MSATGRAVRRSVETGSIKPIERHVKNKVEGRLLGEAGFRHWLWK
ncbi:MAG: hypothetical protein ACYDAG_18420 [Chloroflexota bacterium]